MTKQSRREFLRDTIAGLFGALLAWAGLSKADEIDDTHSFLDDVWVFPLDEVDLNPWDDLPDGPATVEIWDRPRGVFIPRPTLDDGEEHFFVWRWDRIGDHYNIDGYPVYEATRIEQRMIDNIKDLYGHLIDSPEGTMTAWVTTNTRFENDGYDADWERWLV